MRVNLVHALTIADEDGISIPGNRKITAEWTGRSPCLCSGEWIITVGGEKVELPDEVRTRNMGTNDVYCKWHFGEDGREEWDEYEGGLDFEPWLEQNAWWVSRLCLSPAEERALYDAINEQDWRHMSCGGCI